MIDETLLRNVLKAIKEKPELTRDIIDSYSDNQFKSKNKVLSYINDLDIVDTDSEVIIFGSWYGSILIPGLANKVKRITCIDIDERVLRTAKNNLFNNYNNIDFIAADMFEKDRERYQNAKLFINTSCEHMTSMKDWPFWPNNAYFIFTSNNMETIEGHINCVYSIEEFKEQLPINSIILAEDEIADERGIRYLIAGKIN